MGVYIKNVTAKEMNELFDEHAIWWIEPDDIIDIEEAGCKTELTEPHIYGLFRKGELSDDDIKELKKQIGQIIEYADRKTEPKRGEWIEHKGRTIVRDNNFIDFFPTEYECSNCGYKESMYFINSKPHNFCPNCGARMAKK